MEHSTRTRQRKGIYLLRKYGHALRASPVLWSVFRCLREGAVSYVLSAAALANAPLPLCLGFLVSLSGDWSILAAACGGTLGYLTHWGTSCLEPLAGLVAGLLGAAVFSGTELRKQPWFSPALCGIITGSLSLLFLLNQTVTTWQELVLCLLRTGAALGSGLIFRQGVGLNPWFCAPVIMGLCQIVVFRVVDLGLAAAALLVCMQTDALLWALLCGLAVDLSQISPVPMTPILCLSLLIPGKHRRLAPAICSIPAMLLAGSWDGVLPLSLFLGGICAFHPPAKKAEAVSAAQPDRLDAAADALEYLQTVLESPLPQPPQTAALFDHAADAACRGCSRWNLCWQRDAQETCDLLARAAPPILDRCTVDREDLQEFLNRCRRPDAFFEATQEALAALRLRRQYAARLEESRKALRNQYRFLARYLRQTAREPEGTRIPRYRVELGVGATGKFGLHASGDRGAHFPAPNARYFVVLCDGMGSGVGAARESDSALRLLSGMLQSGLPPEAALETLNDFYVLRETAGFSTADVLELHLDTGRAVLYKWGAAPSYLKHRRVARRMGSAAPPPGVGIGKEHRAEVIRLSLQKEEMVVLVSDGLGEEETQARIAAFSGQSPKALAAHLVAGPNVQEEDDRTAVAVRLHPLSPQST